MAKRRTAASQERMRIISQLARREKKDDNFGMRDEDWDVYKAINKVRCVSAEVILHMKNEWMLNLEIYSNILVLYCLKKILPDPCNVDILEIINSFKLAKDLTTTA